MFLYILRLLLAFYFIRNFASLLKPNVISMLIAPQDKYLEDLRRSTKETREKCDRAILQKQMESNLSSTGITYQTVVRTAYILQLTMVLVSALLIQNIGYLNFVICYSFIVSSEYVIMRRFECDEATPMMMVWDRIVFVLNYIVYIIIIMSLVLL